MTESVKLSAHNKLKFVVFLLVFGPVLMSSEWHVDPQSGLDTNKGTEQAPFKTIGAALHLATKGGTILLHAGTYTEMISVDHKGSENKWLRIKRHKDEKVIWKSKPHGMVVNGSHVEIDGIEFTNITKNGIVTFANNLIIRNCLFTGGNLAIKHNDKKKRHHHVLIENCTFYDYWDIAIFPDNIDGLIVRNNFFAFTSRNGVMPQIDPGGVKDLVLENNVFYYQGKKRGPLKIRSGDGEGFSEGDAFNAYGGIVRNNIFVGGDKYSVLIASSNGVCMYNNTLVNNVNGRVENGMLYIHREVVDVDAQGNPFPNKKRPHGPNKNNVFKNNILYLNAPDKTKGYHKNVLVEMHPTMGKAAAIVAPATKRDEFMSQTFENNLYFKTKGEEYIFFLDTVLKKGQVKGWGADFDQNSIIGSDPKFTTQDINDKNAFTLADASPCIDAGTHLTQTKTKGTGTVIQVNDARYFTNGLGMVTGDEILVGKERVRVVARDIHKHTITVDKQINWEVAVPINVVYEGKAPDIGAVERDSERIVGDTPHRQVKQLK